MQPLHPATKVGLLYLLVALSWVFATDLLLLALRDELNLTAVFTMAKGSGFVLGTAVVLMLLLRRMFDRLIAARQGASEGEARIRALVESAGDIVFTVDTELRYTGLYGPLATHPARAAMLGRTPFAVFGDTRGPGQTALIQRALDGEVVTYEWIRADEPLISFTADESVHGIRVTLTPLRSEEGTIVGTVGIGQDITRSLDAERERDANRRELDWLATHDDLTDLPNRRLLRERLELDMAAAQRTGKQVALHFIDVDEFKDVNDAFGHLAGDELIRAAAARLSDLMRQGDLVARIGGDEFVVVQAGVESEQAAAGMADAILHMFAAPFDVGQQQVHLSASVGIARYPVDAQDAADLMQAADVALYAAKAEGRNRYAFFDPATATALRDRLEMTGALLEAVRNGQVRINVQPIVEAGTGRLVAVEALARWNDPYRGQVPPDVFIRLAEAGGFIHELGASVHAQAFRWLSQWRAQGHDIRITVNVSTSGFRRPDFLPQIQRAVAQNGLDPSLVVIELTEDVFIKESGASLDAMRRVREAGFLLAIDDYGTGYASIGYLRHLPVAYLKLAREFAMDAITNERDREIVRSSIALGQHLGMRVIVEGVEEPEEHELLTELGADYIQGYLIARPMPPEEFERWCQSYAGPIGVDPPPPGAATVGRLPLRRCEPRLAGWTWASSAKHDLARHRCSTRSPAVRRRWARTPPAPSRTWAW
ncbi:MAG: EAL domain-containing protein [Chloroflexi bacterium]|nr:EAL domain-containing protein [Chloroflexota bacterium]